MQFEVKSHKSLDEHFKFVIAAKNKERAAEIVRTATDTMLQLLAEDEIPTPIEHIKAGQTKARTESGIEIIDLRMSGDANDSHPIIGLAKLDSFLVPWSWNAKGEWLSTGGYHKNNLVFTHLTKQ